MSHFWLQNRSLICLRYLSSLFCWTCLTKAQTYLLGFFWQPKSVPSKNSRRTQTPKTASWTSTYSWLLWGHCVWQLRWTQMLLDAEMVLLAKFKLTESPISALAFFILALSPFLVWSRVYGVCVTLVVLYFVPFGKMQFAFVATQMLTRGRWFCFRL